MRMYALFCANAPFAKENIEHLRKIPSGRAFDRWCESHEEEIEAKVRPHLPWARDHFLERVSGEPLNPGNEYKNWPFYKYKASNDTFRTIDEKFSHTYMERFWPKLANKNHTEYPHRGIRFDYGDFADVIELIAKDPHTRQAFLPIWFPEDTGAVHGERVPCTLGYHFIQREGFLHIVYYIRSCDIIRHFRDDIYLAMRLVHVVLDEIKKKTQLKWSPGKFTMHITSLHCFAHEKGLLKRSNT